MGMVSYPNHTVNQDLVQTAPEDNYFEEDKYPLLFPSPMGDSSAPLRDIWLPMTGALKVTVSKYSDEWIFPSLSFG